MTSLSRSILFESSWQLLKRLHLAKGGMKYGSGLNKYDELWQALVERPGF